MVAFEEGVDHTHDPVGAVGIPVVALGDGRIPVVEAEGVPIMLEPAKRILPEQTILDDMSLLRSSNRKYFSRYSKITSSYDYTSKTPP